MKWLRFCRFLSILVTTLLPVAVQAGMGMGFGGGSTSPSADLVITPGPMKSPMRIAPVGDGMFVATDYQGSAIYKVAAADPDHPVELFKIEGQPLAVEIVGRRILVGNDSTGAVEVYRRDGKKMGTFRAAGEIQPSDIAYDRRHRLIFVADTYNREVKVYSRNGRIVSAFGGTAPLSDPKGIAVDPSARQVFVSDYGDPRVGISPSVNVFDYKGRLIHRIAGKLSRPQGVEVDARNIYVVDAMLGQVLVFDRATYVLKGTVGNFGVEPGQLLLPMDLVRDNATGRLAVTNNRMGRVSIFDPPNF